MTRPPNPDEMVTFRDRVRLFIKSRSITVATISKETGMGTSTITEFLGGKYTGDNEAIARKLEIWYRDVSELPPDSTTKEFVTTEVATRCINLMRQCRSSASIGLIYGPAGCGKSLAARAAAAGEIGNTVYFEAHEGYESARFFLRKWSQALKISPITGTIGDMLERIIDKLRDSRRLQIIDEAHFLSPKGIRIVRDVVKQARVGVVLIGTGNVATKTEDRDDWHGQISSLVQARYDIEYVSSAKGGGGAKLFSVDEVRRVIAAMDYEITDAGFRIVNDLVNEVSWGGLRSLGSLLELADAARRQVGKSKQITVHHVRSAYLTMRGDQDWDRRERTLRQDDLYTKAVKEEAA